MKEERIYPNSLTETEYREQLKLELLMEEMAGAPREPVGERQPGEKCSYEKYQSPKVD